MKAIIVDDEPKAIALLESYIKHFNDIKIVGTFRNGLKAFDFLSKEKIDLIFLDINMPHLSGIALSKMIDPKTKIIFTTAYSEFAVESYEVEAIDYLLKPISLERFTKSISKLLSFQEETTAHPTKVIIIKSGAKIFRVDTDDILYLVKDGNYITYHTNSQKILARASIAESLSDMPSHFIQTHKSHIVNIQKIDFIDKNEISIQGHLLPIGNSFKEKVLSQIAKN